MKYILSILILILSISVFGQTTYYVANDGDDGALGTSPSTAWETIVKVENSSFSGGDSILFNKGDTWREAYEVTSSGSVGAYLYHGAYGTGDRPRLLGSDPATEFSNIKGNVWRAGQEFNDPYSGFDHEVMFEELDESITWGWKKVAYTTDLSNLTEEYEWTWNNDSIYVYSPSDPDSRYSAVEVPQRIDGIKTDNNNYLAFDSLYVAYWKETGFRDPSDDFAKIGLLINNCEIAYIGEKASSVGYGIYLRYSEMTIKNSDFHDCGRRAITTMVISGMAVTLNRNNLLVENCTFHNGFHTTGLDLGVGDVYGVYDSVIIRNNHFYEDPNYDIEGREGYESNFLYFENDQFGTYTNWYIYNNIFETHNGKGLAFWNIDTLYIANNTFYSFNSTLLSYQGFLFINGLAEPKAGSEIHILNNITYNNSVYATNNNLMNLYVDENVYPHVSSDYNLYYTTDASSPLVVLEGATRYTMSGWNDYKTATGWEDNSPTPADPLFTDAPNSDFSLQITSPANETALSLSFVTTDYLGNARDPLTPSIGAYEFQGTDSTATKILTFSIPSQESSVITLADSSIAVVMPYGTDVSALTATWTLSPLASSTPTSETSQNYTTPLTIDVTANKGNSQEWTVTVTLGDTPPTPIPTVVYDIKRVKIGGTRRVINSKYIVFGK